MEYAYPPWPLSATIICVTYGLLIGLELLGWFVILRWKDVAWPVIVFLAAVVIGFGLLEVKVEHPDLPRLAGTAFWAVAMLGLSGLAFGYLRYAGGTAAAWLVVAMATGFLFLIAPALSNRKRAATRMECLNNLHQLIIGIHNHAATHEGKLPAPISEIDQTSWRVQILPYADATALYRAYHHDKPWNDPANEEYAKKWLKVYSCPSNPYLKDKKGRYYSAYAMLIGPETMFDGSRSLSLDELGEKKGLSNTAVLGEACGMNIVWNEPRDVDVAQVSAGINLPGKTRGTSDGWLSSFHRDAANVAFADGSVHTLSANIDPKVLKALTTPDPSDNAPDDIVP